MQVIHKGFYQCIAWNYEGESVSGVTEVSVLNKPAEYFQKTLQDTLIADTSSVNVAHLEGETVVFRCVRANNSYNIMWLKDDLQINKIDQVDNHL